MEYKILEHFPNYKIYDNGTIWSEYSNKFLTPYINEKGYAVVKLYSDEWRKQNFLVHQLVALCFLDNPNNYEQVNHKDENKLNNDVSNLEWCNSLYNSNYGTRGQRISEALSKKPIVCVELNQRFSSAAEAERELGIDASSIRKVCNGYRKTAGGYHWYNEE